MESNNPNENMNNANQTKEVAFTRDFSKQNNIVTKILQLSGIDFSKYDTENPEEISKLIRSNLEIVAKTLYNEFRKDYGILKQYDLKLEFKKFFTHKLQRELTKAFQDTHNAVITICQEYDSLENNKIQEALTLIGIDNFENLPPECDLVL